MLFSVFVFGRNDFYRIALACGIKHVQIQKSVAFFVLCLCVCVCEFDLVLTS